MATYDQFENVGRALLDERSVLPVRALYGTEEFASWVQNDLPKLMPPDWNKDDSQPVMQVFDVLYRYVTGDDMRPHNRKFKPLGAALCLPVWEFKTPSVRVFGWVPQKDVFVCAFGALKYNLVNTAATGSLSCDGYIAKTNYVRCQCGFADQVVESREISDVISISN